MDNNNDFIKIIPLTHFNNNVRYFKNKYLQFGLELTFIIFVRKVI